jgi:hypothetical protein
LWRGAEIYVELDVRGSYVQDCEVCCNPWKVHVSREDGELYVEIGRADGSEQWRGLTAPSARRTSEAT